MAGNILVRVRVDDKGTYAIEELGNTAKRTKPQVESLGATMKKAFAVVGVYKGIEMTKNLMVQGVRSSAEYELALKRISAITGTTGESLGMLSDKARELAATTEHTATQIAKGMLSITKMGLSTEQTISAIDNITDLATASGEELSWVAQNTINIIKAFKMEYGETEQVANVVATALNQTSLNLEDYMESMKYVAPVANSLNMSLEESTAILGLLSDMSLRGSIAGTTLKNMLLNLLNVTPGVAASLKSVKLEGKTLTEIMEILNANGISVNDVLKQFKKRAISGALAVGENAGAVKELQKRLEEQKRTAKEMSDITRDSLIMQWKIMVSVLNEVGLSLNDALGDDQASLIQNLTGYVQDLNIWIDENQSTIRQWGDSILNVAGIIGDNLKAALALVIPNLSALAAGFAVYKAGKFANVIMTSVIPAFNKLNTASLTLNPALLAIAITFAEIIKRVDAYTAKLDDMTERVNSSAYTSDSHVNDLKEYMKAVSDYSKAMDDWESSDEAKRAGLIGRMFDKKAAINSEKLRLEEAQKKLNTQWGYTLDYTKDYEKDLTKIENQLMNILYLRDQSDKDPKGVSRSKKKGGGYDLNLPTEDGDGDSKSPLRDSERSFYPIDEDLFNLQGAKGDFPLGLGLQADASYLDTFRQNVEKRVALEMEAEKAIRDAHKTTVEKKLELDTWLIDMQIEMAESELVALIESEQRAIDSITSSFFSMGESVSSVVNTMFTSAHESRMEQLEAEMSLVDKRYRKESEAAGNSLYKKTMAENKYAKEKEKISKKMQKEQEDLAKQQAAIRMATATADAIAGAIGVGRDTPGGVGTRAAAIAAYSAIALAWVAEMAASVSQFREGSKGPVEGDGNSTSDSIVARISKKEWVLSEDDVNTLGGDEALRMMLDMGGSYSGGSKEIHIHNVIGTKEFVREDLIPTLSKELNR